PFEKTVEVVDGNIQINGKQVVQCNTRNPEELPWEEYDVDVVIEATGVFNSQDGASKHLRAGAKKVVLTAPGKEVDNTIVLGVNEDTYDAATQDIISNASCTTNCLAPIVKVLDDAFTIENGLMTTVHAYTTDQVTLDNPHSDLRRARACGQSIIPTSTGAAKALGEVLPHLNGKLHGMALRVPTPNVSLVDLVVDVKEDVTVEDVNNAFKKAAEESMQGVLDYSDEPLVSIDYTSNEFSAIVDGLSTIVIEDRKVKVLAWYDNEWGYSARVVDLVKHVGKALA